MKKRKIIRLEDLNIDSFFTNLNSKKTSEEVEIGQPFNQLPHLLGTLGTKAGDQLEVGEIFLPSTVCNNTVVGQPDTGTGYIICTPEPDPDPTYFVGGGFAFCTDDTQPGELSFDIFCPPNPPEQESDWLWQCMPDDGDCIDGASEPSPSDFDPSLCDGPGPLIDTEADCSFVGCPDETDFYCDDNYTDPYLDPLSCGSS